MTESFSETLMDHFQAPRNRGRLELAECVGTAGTYGQGRFIEFSLRIVDDRVEEMYFNSYGCGVTIAVCSVLTELVEGMTKEECLAIQPEAVAAALDGIPAHKMDCPQFALVALHNALANWPEE